jgi:hypothetical protein
LVSSSALFGETFLTETLFSTAEIDMIDILMLLRIGSEAIMHASDIVDEAS